MSRSQQGGQPTQPGQRRAAQGVSASQVARELSRPVKQHGCDGSEHGVAACRVSRIAELQQQKLGRTKFETPLVETLLRMAAVQEEGRNKAGKRQEKGRKRQVDRRGGGR
jgi:hypothetical protein